MQNEEIIDSENLPPPFHNEASEIVEPEEISPNNPPWNALTAFLVWLGSVFLIFLLQGIFVAAFAIANNQTNTAELINDPKVLLLSVISVLPAHALTLVLAWAVVTRFNKNPFFKTLGWSFGNFRWWQFPIILGIFFIFAAVVTLFFPEQENELTKILASSRAAVFVVAFMATFSAPITEEVVYRGIVYSGFRKTFNVPVAVIVTTVLFAGVHYPQYWGSWGTIILITTLSLILTFIRVRSDNLLPCVVLHFIFNGIQSIVLIFEPYLKQAAEKEQIPALIMHLFK